MLITPGAASSSCWK